MSTIDVHCVKVAFVLKTLGQALDLAVLRGQGLFWVEYIFLLPNGANSGSVLVSCLVLRSLIPQ